MMEETPRAALRDVDPSTLWVAYGYEPRATDSRVERFREAARPEGYAYIFPKRDHVNIGIGYVLSHYRERDRRGAVRAAARVRRAAPRPRRRRRRVGAAELHAVPDSGRRAAARAGTRPRAAGGRRRRIRERLHRRGHLLRDGVGRSGGARHRRDHDAASGIWPGAIAARAITKLAPSCAIRC